MSLKVTLMVRPGETTVLPSRKTVALVVLYVLAAPALLVAWLVGLRRTVRKLQLLRAGWVTCTSCGSRNPLNVKATCRRCGITEYGSRLFCTQCRQVSTWFDCASCGASIRVL